MNDKRQVACGSCGYNRMQILFLNSEEINCVCITCGVCSNVTLNKPKNSKDEIPKQNYVS